MNIQTIELCIDSMKGSLKRLKEAVVEEEKLDVVLIQYDNLVHQYLSLGDKLRQTIGGPVSDILWADAEKKFRAARAELMIAISYSRG